MDFRLGYAAAASSMGWYAHHRPKVFSGGALRLHALMGDKVTDIEPAHDLMVAFPSWMPHEVMPVSIPGGRSRIHASP